MKKRRCKQVISAASNIVLDGNSGESLNHKAAKEINEVRRRGHKSENEVKFCPNLKGQMECHV